MPCPQCGNPAAGDVQTCPRCTPAAAMPPPYFPNAYPPAAAYPPQAPLSTGQFLVMMLIQSVPLLGLVMLCVWAFGDGNLNRRNYARAVLIFWIIGAIAAIALFLLFFGLYSAGSNVFPRNANGIGGV